MHLEDALERYLTQLRANGRSEHTVLQVQRHVRLLGRWVAGERCSCALGDIDEDVLARFLASDAARLTDAGPPKSTGTMNALRSSMKTFFAHAARAGWIDRDAARLIRRANCSPPPPRGLTTREEGRLRAVLDAAQGPEAERDRVLFELMLATGIRLSSALGLDVDDVDLEEGVLHLRRMKGGRIDRVFLGTEIRERLRIFIGERRAGPVFAGRGGLCISARHAQRRLRQWREAAGISAAVTAHSLRHAFGQRLYDRTRDLLLVRAALRHASISSTLVYARVDQERVRAAMAES